MTRLATAAPDTSRRALRTGAECLDGNTMNPLSSPFYPRCVVTLVMSIKSVTVDDQ